MVEEQKGEDYIEIKVPNQEAPAQEEATVSKEKPEKKPIKPVKKTTRKKKSAKKSTKKKATKKKPAKEPKGSNWLWAILLLIGLVVIAAVIYLSVQQPTQVETTEEERVVALVNNEPIYQSEVEEIYAKLPPEVLKTTTEEDILEQLIEQQLLLQEARTAGYSVTPEELDAYMEELKTFFSMDDAQLEAALAAQDMTLEEFEKNSKNQILINNYVNDTIYKNIVVTEEQIAARYEAEKELFKIPETAIVKHILIAPEENETEAATKARAEEVLSLVEEDVSNFCELVEEHTADPASIPTCGEYEVTANSNFDVEFKTEALAMDVDDIQLVQSQFGYHVMLKTDHKEAGYLSLEEVAADIEAVIKQENSSVQIAALIKQLRDDATIEKYSLNADEEIVTAPLPVEEEAEQEEQIEAEVEKTKPVREGDFGKCLEEQGATLYGVTWSPDVTAQKELLGEAIEEVNYVDCDPAEGEAPAACDDITVYPTWIIGDTTLQGLQSVNALARETGCQA